jgi:hypothetical protein
MRVEQIRMLTALKVQVFVALFAEPDRVLLHQNGFLLAVMSRARWSARDAHAVLP